MQLAIGHAATLKPAVKDLLHPVQLTFALLAGDGDVVYEVPVQVGHLQAHATCQHMCHVSTCDMSAYGPCQHMQQQRVVIHFTLHPLSVYQLLLLDFTVMSTECLCGPVTEDL